MYKIVFHNIVLKEDLRKISKFDQEKILKAIYRKLTVSPETFGKLLTGPLQGFYRLRIHDYRAVYQIKKKDVVVFIFKIGQRKDSIVYFEAIKRLKWLDLE